MAENEREMKQIRTSIKEEEILQVELKTPDVVDNNSAKVFLVLKICLARQLRHRRISKEAGAGLTYRTSTWIRY